MKVEKGQIDVIFVFHKRLYKMKKISFLISFSLLIGGYLFTGCNDNSTHENKVQKVQVVSEKHNPDDKTNRPDDGRTQLIMSPQKAQHQLKNMRSHMQAVQMITYYLSNDQYDSAALVATNKLGLTEEMKTMCSSFGNPKFESLGIAFHKSADRMSDILKTRDKDKSLEALALTMKYCVTCHATFRQ